MSLVCVCVCVSVCLSVYLCIENTVGIIVQLHEWENQLKTCIQMTTQSLSYSHCYEHLDGQIATYYPCSNHLPLVSNMLLQETV